jgi:hypothetical protein
VVVGSFDKDDLAAFGGLEELERHRDTGGTRAGCLGARRVARPYVDCSQKQIEPTLGPLDLNPALNLLMQ